MISRAFPVSALVRTLCSGSCAGRPRFSIGVVAPVGRRTWWGSTAPRPVGVGRSLGAVAAAAALPGLGHVLLGRRRTGAWVMGVFAAGATALLVTAVHLGRAGLLRSLVSPDVLLAVSVVCVLVMVAWMAVIMWTYVATDPGGRSPRHQVLGVVVSAALCAAVAVPLGTAADLANTQRALLDRVFAGGPPAGPAAPARRSGAAAAAQRPSPGHRRRAGPHRRPDRHDHRGQRRHPHGRHHAVRVAPQHRARAVPAGLPGRHAVPPRFPRPARADSGDYLLNNVVEYGRAHPELAPAGPTADRGVNLLMSSVSTMLGLPIDHYVAVDMNGLAALIDALGGVTVDVGPEPLPIGGVTYSGRRVTPDGYVPAGVQHLDGEQALWYARSRRDSDDYDRMARQRCLISAVLAQKRPSDVVARFRTIASAAAVSVTTNIPRALLPALLEMADEHRPALRSVSFDPDLPDPGTAAGGSTPVDPDTPFMRRVVRAALAPPVVAAPAPPRSSTPPAPSSVAGGAPAASASALPAPVAVAASCTDRS